VLFKKRAQTAQTSPPPGPTHIHNHTPGQAGEVWAKISGAVVLIVLAWFALVFLAGQAGVDRPTEVVAQGLFWVGGILAVVWLLGRALGEHLDRWYAHCEAIEEQKTNQMRYRQLLAGSAATDSRRLGDEKRLAALVYLVVLDAYDYLARNRKFRGVWRPWSKRSAGAYTLISLGETSPVGNEFGARVRPFLETTGIITGDDQVDQKHFPDLASVQRVLYQPVLARSAETSLDRSNWSIIE
jgi:hypothetical protein